VHSALHGGMALLRSYARYTEPSWIQRHGLSDPNQFFQTLATKPYRDHVVLAPHLYGVSVTRSPDVGRLQWEKFETSW
jgi:hypothetical protein